VKIEQVHVRHRTWHTRVTVGDKTFGLQRLDQGYRVHIPFGGATQRDFDTRDEALEYCRASE
jgi:hypothetical protein